MKRSLVCSTIVLCTIRYFNPNPHRIVETRDRKKKKEEASNGLGRASRVASRKWLVMRLQKSFGGLTHKLVATGGPQGCVIAYDSLFFSWRSV